MNQNINVVEEFLKGVAIITYIASILGIVWGVLILLEIL